MSRPESKEWEDTLARFEKTARELDTNPSVFGSWMKELESYSTKLLKELPTAPVYFRAEKPGWLNIPLPFDQTPFSDVLAEFHRGVLETGIYPASGRFLGYVPGGGVPSAAVGDFLAALSNKYAGMYQASPGAAEIENLAVEWLRDMIGFPATAWGTLTSGGTPATITALIAARETREWSEWSRSVIYLTSECHFCIEKSLGVLGLGRVPRRKIKVDSEFRMSVEELEAQIETDRAEGLSPWILIASAGTINTGAIDPLSRLVSVARREKMWFHVDAAYGGFFVQTKEGKSRLAGIEACDSLVLDPHKALFMPYGLGAALVRDGRYLRAGLSFEADYIADVTSDEERSPTDYSLELTRHFRSLRFWMSLKIHGFERFRAALEEKLLLTQWTYDRLSAMDELEMGPSPQLTCIAFRVKKRPSDSDPEKRTREVLKNVVSRGRIYLNSTRLDGQLYIRLCILNFRTHLGDLKELISELSMALANL